MGGNGEALNGLVGLVQRLADLIPPAQALVAATCFIIGIVLAIASINSFVKASERAASGQHVARDDHGRWIGMAGLITAVMLVSLSSAISAFLMSFFQVDETVAASEIFAYAPEMLAPLDHEQARSVIIALLRVVQFLGLLGFIRGLMLLNQSVKWPAPGLVGFGVVHLIGGTFAMNIVMFVGYIEELVLG
ncbi:MULTISPECIES: hypothetical protein [Hyphomicrobiales]|uniref:hypothetical protein n=1 Tax=Hyphomicrobiales TaxID=356 RepID=UPI000DBF417B|nr:MULTISPECIES: hypothetical protein [Hyphomicrobiales]RAL97906.1 hypothetical protein DOU54_09880 [Agrobacterium sp. MS2]UZD72187.1 hypothetical protein LJ361_23030 [Brucella sp. JSBI001]